MSSRYYPGRVVCSVSETVKSMPEQRVRARGDEVRISGPNELVEMSEMQYSIVAVPFTPLRNGDVTAEELEVIEVVRKCFEPNACRAILSCERDDG
jgi:hypothetical protein